MPKKLRIAILYNEPVAGSEENRKYIGENGKLNEGPLPRRKVSNGKTAVQSSVDLSELGVLEEMQDIKAALDTIGYKASIFNVDSNVGRLIDYLREQKPGLIFNLVECVENESIQEMNIAGLYELMKIPYTGANPMTLGTALNKARVKEILTYHGINTPKFQLVRTTAKATVRDDLRFPLIVKPSREDASVGISDESIVNTVSDLRKRIRYIHQEFDQAALVEEYVEGREFNVAIVGNRKPIVFPISEIDFSGLTDGMHRIVSYEAKWMNGTVAYEGTKGVCPANITSSLESQLKDIALRCYQLIGCRDYARVDFRVSKDNTPYMLEVNPNPDISDDAGFARSARAYGWSFPEVVTKIVESALERCS